MSQTSELTEIGFKIKNQTSRPVYAELVQTPELARRFGSTTCFFWSSSGFDLEHLFTGHDWVQLERADGVIIDIAVAMVP